MTQRWTWVVLAAICPTRLCAALGDSLPSVEADRVALKASIRTLAATRYTVHEIQTPEGTVVREYVSATGLVFAVQWAGNFMPNLQQTLGRYFEPYQAAVRVKRRGHSAVTIETPTLVVHSGGRQRAFFGLAYLPQAVPAGVTASELQ